MPTVNVVIGAGIVGLHIAHILNELGHEVFVLDQESYLAEQSSGRNSGVVHAGIYYEPGSLKEGTCIDGNRLTYEWLERLKVDYRACGKWVVPEEGQEEQLEPFFERVRSLPIPEPSLLTAEEVQKEEPNLRATRGIKIPSTGIVDAAAYVKALAAYLENKGVTILTNCEVQEVDGQTLKTTRGEISFDLAVNSAGLFADEIAEKAGLASYEVRPCRGDYYILPKAPLKRPVYHLPYQGAHGLGVHLTPTLDHQTLLGPNAFFIDDKADYQHRSDPEVFERAIDYYLPDYPHKTITHAYSGNRPKLYHKGQPVSDFTVIYQDPWVHLLGIESPGLTAAPALARHVMKLIQ